MLLTTANRLSLAEKLHLGSSFCVSQLPSQTAGHAFRLLDNAAKTHLLLQHYRHLPHLGQKRADETGPFAHFRRRHACERRDCRPVLQTFLSRRCRISRSSTSLSSSTAHHRYMCFPPIRTTISSKCHQDVGLPRPWHSRRAQATPNLPTHRRTVCREPTIYGRPRDR